MSRMTFVSNYNNRKFQVDVGWDDPLETFFGIVYDLSLPEDDQIILWVGATPAEISTVSELDTALGGYCYIPETVAAVLIDAYNNRKEPTPLQKFVREGLTKEI